MWLLTILGVVMVAANLICEGKKSLTSKTVSMIRKVMGYGLMNVQTQKGQCADSRISKCGYLFDDTSYSISGFINYLQDKRALLEEPIDPRTKLSDCVHFAKGQSGFYNLCLVVPHHVNEWYRRDNLMDIAESDAQPLRTFSLNKGIPGYRALMDSRNGRPISGSLYLLFKQRYDKYHSPLFCDAEQLTQEFALAELASDLGFGTIDDVMSCCVPMVPLVLRHLAGYLNLFVDTERTVLTLRPMVFSYAE